MELKEEIKQELKKKGWDNKEVLEIADICYDIGYNQAKIDDLLGR